MVFLELANSWNIEQNRHSNVHILPSMLFSIPPGRSVSWSHGWSTAGKHPSKHGSMTLVEWISKQGKTNNTSTPISANQRDLRRLVREKEEQTALGRLPNCVMFRTPKMAKWFRTCTSKPLRVVDVMLLHHFSSALGPLGC